MKRIKFTAWLLVLVSLMICFSGCSSSPTAMKIGSYKISYDMLRYFVMNYKNGYEGVSPDEFEKSEELQKALTDNTDASLKELAAYKMLSDEYNIKLTDEQKEQIKNAVKSLKDGYNSEQDYLDDMKKNYVTEDVYREIVTLQAYCDSLYDYLTDEVTGIFRHDDATIMGDIEKGNFFSAEYMYIKYGEGDYQSKKDFANGLCERIQNGEEMAIIFAQYQNEYLLASDYVKLPAFTYHEQNEFFEETVLSLKEGETAKLVEQDGMFLIIKRLSLDEEYIDKNFNDIIASYLSREFFDYVEEYSSKLEIKMTGKYKELKYWEIT